MKNEESTDVPVRQDATGPKLKLQATGREGRSRTSFRPPLKMGTCVFFGATALLLYLRLMYHVSFFPPFWEGEEAKVLDTAKDTCDFAVYMHSWWQALIGGLNEYNKGFSLIL